jgi:glycerol-3-phosphate dehydrogenase
MTQITNPRANCCADIVILGGGIAGLWMLNHLTAKGYSVLLLESTALGNGQSVASQGIIHGGLKYALGGTLSGTANAIAGMPDRWRSCLAGNDPVDLTGCRLLSDHYYMWSEGSYRSKLKTFLGSKSLAGKVEVVADTGYPDQLAMARGQGSLYRLPDFVVDTVSLLETLARGNEDRIFKIDPAQLKFVQQGENRELLVKADDSEITLTAQRYIFAAGEGNAGLLKAGELSSPEMQRRPLNMVIVRKASLPRLFVHCIGDNFSLTPQLTLTSHSCNDGRVAWYLGGEVAESGVSRTDSEQIEEAGRSLQRLFSWVDLSDAEWACLRIDRAEGRQRGRHRPDSVFLEASGNVLVTWPTKFTLSPALADEVCDALSSQGIKPEMECRSELLAASLNSATVAAPPWEVCFEHA